MIHYGGAGMWGQFTPGSKAKVAPERKNCTGASQIVGKRGLPRLRCRTLTLEAERHCLCRALSWNHLCRRQVAPRNARWRLRSRTCTLVVAGQITGLRTAGSELWQAKGFLDRSSSLEGGSGHNKPLSRLRPETLRARGN